MSLRSLFSGELSSFIGERVTLRGWFHAIRALGKIAFLIIRDRDGLAQAVLNEIEYAKLKDCHIGSVISVSGLVSPSKKKDGKPELADTSVEVISAVREAPFWDYTKNSLDIDLDLLLDYRGFSLRNPVISSIFRIQGEIGWIFRSYMREKLGACEFFGPCLLPGSFEGGAHVFSTDHFGFSATLAQSNQLYKQILVGVYERVFSIMPFFRADPSHTTRHLSEGKQMEFECGFSSLKSLLEILEDLLRTTLKHITPLCPDVKLPLLPEKSFPRISFQEVCQFLDLPSLTDLGSSEEKKISLWVREKYNSDFVFITHWPRASRPFYSAPFSEQETETFDLICCGVEITSGGMRRNTYEQVMEGLAEFGLSPIPFKIYLQAFEAGMPPHGGFGMGLERLTMVLLGLKNIREASLFPSDHRRIASEKQEILGGEAIRSEIIQLLRRKCFPFSLSGSESLQEDAKGIKALLLIGKKSGILFQANLLLQSKLNIRLLGKMVGEDLTFADPKYIEKCFGLKVGNIPPFGFLFGVRTFLDRKAHEMTGKIHFSSGRSGEVLLLEGSFPILGAQEIVEISLSG